MSLRAEILSNTKPERFLQKSGQRKGQHFRVKRGKSGRNVRIYETGDTAIQPLSAAGKAGQKTASIPKDKLVGVDPANAEVSEAQRGMNERIAANKRRDIGHQVQAHDDDITEARRQFARRKSGSLQAGQTALSRIQNARAKDKAAEAERRKKIRGAGGR